MGSFDLYFWFDRFIEFGFILVALLKNMWVNIQNYSLK